ncbi:MAG TPA: transcription antitermination factor NusB [Jiangellales bacterium]|nr:transcription antitermination factor NusB [Jiangellales bacterium]
MARPRTWDPKGSRRPQRRPRDAARATALEALRAVTGQDAYANLVLPGLLRERGVTGRDAALATELVYGTLRGLGTYDAVLERCADRPLEALDPAVLDVLRLGTHQLLGTRVPAHAAVASSVDLVREQVGPRPTGLVNAVLRRVASRDLDAWVREIAPPSGSDPVGRLAVREAHPRWVADALLAAVGGDVSELEALLRADNARPEVTLVARPGRAGLDELLGSGATPGRWSPVAARWPAGDPLDVPAVAEGRAGVQDEGSQLVTLALAGAPLTGRDDRWLDLCAGPGGKAALLSALAGERGASVLAVERQPHRARLVARALQGLPRGTVVVADGRAPAWPDGSFDRVLVDVPCSGLGALRRRPESRWRRTPADVAALHPLQIALLGSALAAARPGGVVAYVTCSPHLDETRTVVDEVLRGRHGVERLDARPLLPGVPDLGDGPDVQLWPHRHGTDAMYLSLLRTGGRR